MAVSTNDIKKVIRKDVASIKKNVQSLYPTHEVTVEEVTEGVQRFPFTNKKTKMKTVVYVLIEIIEEV